MCVSVCRALKRENKRASAIRIDQAVAPLKLDNDWLDANRPAEGTGKTFAGVRSISELEGALDAFAPGVDLSTPSLRLAWIEAVKERPELMKTILDKLDTVPEFAAGDAIPSCFSS